MKGTDAYSANRPHHVYRVYDELDRLLYIGCTSDVNGRMAVHRAWGNPSPASAAVHLYGKRVESVEYPDFAAGRAAEQAAIAAEAPYHNREHNPARWRRVRGEGWVEVGEPYQPPPVSEERHRSITEALSVFLGQSVTT